MAKAKIPLTPTSVPANRSKRAARTVSTPESSLLLMRLKELDREFARQTKQLTTLTKKFGKKIKNLGSDQK